MHTALAFKPMTKDDIANVLSVSARTIENWVNDKILPAPKKIGNRVYWHPTVFYSWLEHRLSTEDAAEPRQDVLYFPPEAEPEERKVKARAPRVGLRKTEVEQLRNREQAKLDALLSYDVAT